MPRGGRRSAAPGQLADRRGAGPPRAARAVPPFLARENPRRELERIVDADAAVAEGALRLSEELLARRVVQVDVVRAREQELDPTERVPRAGLLHQAIPRALGEHGRGAD